jgi:serine/threonine-protein kinase
MAATNEDRFGLAGTILEGKYEIEAVVAEGGFGLVYRGVHRALRKPIAIKVLKVSQDHTMEAQQAIIERFTLEARTIARLDHPAIVKVLDFGVSRMPNDEILPWMVLDWLEGRTLSQEFKATRGMDGRSPADCLALLRPVLEAVAVAHEEGIAHRDIKPSNIMLVSGRRGDTQARLLDFGIAKIMGPDEEAQSGQTNTRSGMQAFSLQYAAPEQIGGTRTGPWTDVHALGLLITQLLTSWRPYDGADAMEICSDVLSPVRPTPAKRGLDVGAWEAVLARAVSLRPSARHPDAGSLLKALEAEVPAVVSLLEPADHEGRTMPDVMARDSTLVSADFARPAPALVPRRNRWLVTGAIGAGLMAVASLGMVVGTRLGPAPDPRPGTVPSPDIRNRPVVVPAPVPRPVAPPVADAATPPPDATAVPHVGHPPEPARPERVRPAALPRVRTPVRERIPVE